MTTKAKQERLDKYQRRAQEILETLNIQTQIIGQMKVTKNQVWGKCHRVAPGLYDIQINELLLVKDKGHEAMTTVLHEMLHTVKGCFNHGPKWKELADLVNKNYHYNIKRTTSCDEKGIKEDDFRKVRYILECQGCGYKIKRTKKSKIIKNPEHYLCGKCRGKLKRIK